VNRIRGLYALTPHEPDTAVLVRKVRAAIAGGASVVQYRAKSLEPKLKLAQARELVRCCRDGGVALIVNDDAELALEVEADGVHLGKTDGDLAGARTMLGAKSLIGASCYNELERANAAIAAGADHVAFGSIFTSSTKPGAVRAPLELLRRARRALSVPIVAIGGITPDNAPGVIEAGADAVAVISAVFDASDVESAARRFHDLFDKP
jgi:thiamine-phosphate pyrophosphorylase